MVEMAVVEEGVELLDPVADWMVALQRRRHNIFLSHSGGQKDFTEQLCVDLERANLTPFFDKRPRCLPKGVEFAKRILTAAQECELAIVVVTEQYFTRSKWPMLELVAIVQAPGCKILPLFYGLSSKELNSPKRRQRWFRAWDEWSKSDKRICVDVWKDALRELDGRNGMEFVKAMGEVAFRRAIVTTVCDMIQDEAIGIVDVERATSNARSAHDGRHHPVQVQGEHSGWTFVCTLPKTFVIMMIIIVVGFLIGAAWLHGRCHNSKFLSLDDGAEEFGTPLGRLRGNVSQDYYCVQSDFPAANETVWDPMRRPCSK